MIAVAVPMRKSSPERQPSPKKSPGSQNRNDGLFAGLIDHGNLHAAFLNVHDIIRGVPLAEVDFIFSDTSSTFRDTPAELRNAWASKMPFFSDFYLTQDWKLLS